MFLIKLEKIKKIKVVIISKKPQIANNIYHKISCKIALFMSFSLKKS